MVTGWVIMMRLLSCNRTGRLNELTGEAEDIFEDEEDVLDEGDGETDIWIDKLAADADRCDRAAEYGQIDAYQSPLG